MKNNPVRVLILFTLLRSPRGASPPSSLETPLLPARPLRGRNARGRAIGAKTERERLYIEAIAQYYDRFGERSHGARMKSLADAFEGVAQRLPDDDEAQIFYAGAWTINKTRGSENL